jgi:thiol-disulfide isomerase/thioredoxin
VAGLVLAPAAAAADGAPEPFPGTADVAGAPELVPATAGDLLDVVRAQGAKAVLLNVWATWCMPCREEMPELLRLRREYAESGLSLVLVSGDFEGQEDAALEFLVEQGVDFVTYHKRGDDQEFIDALAPEWSGALPATFVYGPQGRLRRFHEGKASYEDFEGMILDALGAASPRQEENRP